MNADQVRDARQAFIERNGPWRGCNLQLAEEIFTIKPGLVGAAELNVRRVLQIVSDNAPKPLEQLRVLDLGAFEGGFTVELAAHGAHVRSIEGRDAHVARARFAAECLGLENVEITQGDVRDLSRERDGGFDVVLCLGILYHLPAKDIHPFLARVASVCDGFAVIETNISLANKLSVETPAGGLHGRLYSENPHHAGAALDATSSFWPTRSSLLNLLTGVGFSSVSECLNPPVLATAELIDHVTYLAAKRPPVQMRTVPQVDSLEPSTWQWPEGLRRRPSPTNDRRVAIADRIREKFGTSLAQRIRRKS